SRLLEGFGAVVEFAMLSKVGNLFHLRWRDERDRHHAHFAPDLATLLRLALGLPPPIKRCLGPCGQLKPLTDFSRYQQSPDGNNRHCKMCERRRVKEFESIKRRHE